MSGQRNFTIYGTNNKSNIASNVTLANEASLYHYSTYIKTLVNAKNCASILLEHSLMAPYRLKGDKGRPNF